MKLDRWQALTTKVDKWLSNCTLSKGNLQVYELGKQHCADISQSSEEYELAVKYLIQRIKV